MNLSQLSQHSTVNCFSYCYCYCYCLLTADCRLLTVCLSYTNAREGGAGAVGCSRWTVNTRLIQVVFDFDARCAIAARAIVFPFFLNNALVLHIDPPIFCAQ